MIIKLMRAVGNRVFGYLGNMIDRGLNTETCSPDGHHYSGAKHPVESSCDRCSASCSTALSEPA